MGGLTDGEVNLLRAWTHLSSLRWPYSRHLRNDDLSGEGQYRSWPKLPKSADGYADAHMTEVQP